MKFSNIECLPHAILVLNIVPMLLPLVLMPSPPVTAPFYQQGPWSSETDKPVSAQLVAIEKSKARQSDSRTHLPYLFFLVLGWGALLAVLSVYACLCAQGSFLAVLRGIICCAGIESGLTACKASALTAIPTLLSWLFSVLTTTSSCQWEWISTDSHVLP